MIEFIDRKSGKRNVEKVFGESAVRMLYQTGPGYLLERSLLSKKPFSILYGLFNDTPWSARRISRFIADYEIDLTQFVVPPQGFKSFNEFFIRKLQKGQREFPASAGVFGASAEGRYFVFDQISESRVFPVKGSQVSLGSLFQDQADAARYTGGVGIIARLCPVDYHRFHFPDSGVATGARVIAGGLHSVNPVALFRDPEIFQKNQREISFLESDHFGRVALIEVGALCVGRIVQTYEAGAKVARGQEKGYFCFGASTVLIFIEPGRLKVDADLLSHSAEGIETFLQLGERIGSRVG